jgi:hypothetical protein
MLLSIFKKIFHLHYIPIPRLYSKEKRRACLFSFEYNLLPK